METARVTSRLVRARASADRNVSPSKRQRQCGRDRRDRPRPVVGHVRLRAVRRERHPIGVGADRDRAARGVGRDRDRRDRPRPVVDHVRLRAVRRERHPIGVGADRDRAARVLVATVIGVTVPAP